MTGVWDNDKLIRIDMTALSVTIEDYPADWKYLGGRSLSARILLDECDPGCDPLGPDNVLVLRQVSCREPRRPPRGVCP